MGQFYSRVFKFAETLASVSIAIITFLPLLLLSLTSLVWYVPVFRYLLRGPTTGMLRSSGT